MARAVLVPVDASSFAEHALPHGLAIARRTGAVLHVALVDVPADRYAPAYALTGTGQDGLVEDRHHGATYLDELADRLRETGVRIRPVLLRGRPADELARYADAEQIELVVMTTHGRGGFQRAWLGSTTDRMVRQCGAPILVVRQAGEPVAGPESDGLFRRVVAALDGSPVSENALLAALDLCVAADASVTLAHVLCWGAPPEAGYVPQASQHTREDVARADARIREHLEAVARHPALAGRSVEIRVVADYEAGAAILDLAAAADADLVVLGTHGRGGLGRLILGSVADKVVRGTTRPVFVLRCPRAPG
jgi:nucleotide-binding universal stress UspA family protein